MKNSDYGHSDKATGRTPELDKHKGPKEQDKEHHSQMRKVDVAEMHMESKKNMEAMPKHVSSMPISDHHSYKRQAHAVKPNGEIKSFVGKKLDTKPGKEPAKVGPEEYAPGEND